MLALATILLLSLAACGDDDDGGAVAADDDTTATTAAPAGDDGADDGAVPSIEAVDFSLTSVTVSPGAEVEVENAGDKPHTATADDGAFDSGTIEPGASGSITAPSEPGTYAFHCTIHPNMTGALTVEG
jgi:plastocyanin